MKKLQSDEPHGYAIQSVVLIREGELYDLEMLLPCDNASQKQINAVTQDSMRQLLEDKEKLKIEKQTKGIPTGTDNVATKKFGLGAKPDPAAEREGLEVKAQRDDIDAENFGTLPIYDWEAPLKLLDYSRTPDRDLHTRDISIFQRLRDKGHHRSMRTSNADTLLARLDGLKQAQPHFKEITAYVRQQVELARASHKPLKLAPMLIYGEPGVGKTHYSQALATALDSPMHRHGFDSGVSAEALTGVDRKWNSTQHGLVFEAICLGESACPVILLDEIDKVQSIHERSPLAPLYSLLEPLTSRAITDISLGITFDASYVIWVATANDPGRIPAPLRSRFIEFSILTPSGADALQVAHAVASSIHHSTAPLGFESFTKEVINAIAHYSPREQSQLLRRAIASAIENKRSSTLLTDLPVEVQLGDSVAIDSNNERPHYLH